MQPSATSNDGAAQVLGLLGFVSLTAALLIAYANPATAYELSIYASTPNSVWVGIVAAFGFGAAVAFSATSGRYRRVGIVLGGMASLAVVSLPIVRGYFFHGIHDSMTHVGITRELAAGTLSPFETIYPGIHSVGAFLAGVTGFSVWQSMLLVPVVTAIAFYVFTPLVVRAVVGGEMALVVGAFTAFLLVPLHQLAATLHPHPSSQAILFAPVVLFLVVGYLRTASVNETSASAGALGSVLLLTVGASILYHPMQAMNVLLILLGVGIVQFLSKARRSGWSHRSIAPVAAVSVVAFVGWTAQSPAVGAVLQGAVDSLVSYASGSSSGAGAAIGTQASSLSAIGSSPTVVFLKLFGVSTLFILAAGGLVVSLFVRRRADSGDTRQLVVYLATSVVAMGPVFGLYLFGNVGQYYFRQASFMMLLVAALGAIAITYGIDSLSTTRLRNAVGPAAVSVFVVLFLVSSLVLFNSPYIHRANQQVTESRVSGYGATFDMTGEDAIINGVVQEPQRYHDAIIGLSNNGRRDGLVNSTELRRLGERPASDWYMVLSRNTYEREVNAYREHRYSRSDFEGIDEQVGVNRVFSNGDTDLYFVR